MQGVDLSLIKDIPGYKIIMKAVLKHQIQQLVEQLSETTGEESILLTASVSDGSLGHLGSESGKSFLEGHEAIKSQFLGHVLKTHLTKKPPEKQFAEGPGRKSATHSYSHLNEEDSDSSYQFDLEQETTQAPANYPIELQQDSVKHPVVTPTKPEPKKTRPAKKAPTPVEVKVRPKRSAAAMKSPLKSDYVGGNDDIEELSDSVGGNDDIVSISEDEQVQSESVADIQKDAGEKNDTAEYTEIFPVSDPVPVLPKVETGDLLLSQGYSGDSAQFSGAIQGDSIMENIVVKKEAGLDYEAGTMEDEEDPNWEPGTKKRRKSSGSRSVSSPVNVTGPKSLASPVNVGGVQALSVERSTSGQENSCHICTKQFKRQSDLRRHEAVHSEEKPYSCETCGKSFKRKENLKAHYIIHTGEKPYSCEICGKSFTHKTSAKTHMVVHMNVTMNN